MHDRRTPTNLLDGRPWACWGPPVETVHLTDRVVHLIARRSGRSIDEVGNHLLHSQDRGRYLLLEPLSVTGHAAVYAGIDRLLGRDVAVKIHRDKREHATQRAIFESQAMARLEHPNIVRIHDMGEHIHHGSLGEDGEHVAWMYSVIELCDADLQAWHVDLSWTAIVGRVIEAARGLAHLHEVGFAHGDIKPKNILIRDGVAKLADFGHAKRVDTLSLSIGGTVGFMAPEVLDHGPSFAADVYALAVTLWACLFDELPYPVPGEDVTTRTAFLASTQRALDRAIQAPANVPEGLPAGVMRLLEYALDPNPRLRPSLDGFMGRLLGLLDLEARRKRRRRWVPAVAGVLLVAVGVGFAVGVRYRGGAAGEGSLYWTAAALGDPLAHAEAAAHRGDLDAAIGALYRVDSQIASLSPEESLRAAKAAERIAKVLEQGGHIADAESVWIFTVRLYEHAGEPQEAERARKIRMRLLNPDPY